MERLPAVAPVLDPAAGPVALQVSEPVPVSAILAQVLASVSAAADQVTVAALRLRAARMLPVMRMPEVAQARAALVELAPASGLVTLVSVSVLASAAVRRAALAGPAEQVVPAVQVALVELAVRVAPAVLVVLAGPAVRVDPRLRVAQTQRVTRTRVAALPPALAGPVVAALADRVPVAPAGPEPAARQAAATAVRLAALAAAVSTRLAPHPDAPSWKRSPK